MLSIEYQFRIMFRIYNANEQNSLFSLYAVGLTREYVQRLTGLKVSIIWFIPGLSSPR